MKYYKIKLGYAADEFVTVTAEELHRAYYIFLNPTKRQVFKGGAVRGQDIISILPDVHKTLGWNAGYRPQPEDDAEMRPVKSDLEKIAGFAKSAAQTLPENILVLPLTQIAAMSKEAGGILQLKEQTAKALTVPKQ